MRRRDGQVAAIKTAASSAFGDDAVVRRFGSRIDDARRGGDIDLLVLVAATRQTIATLRAEKLI